MTVDVNLDLDLDPTKLAEAWRDPETRRMALVMARAVLGGSQREIAKALGVSIFVYYDLELGRKPLSVALTMEASRLIPDYKQHRCGYARGHLGHALLRRGDSAAAEAAFALAIEEWMSLRRGGSRHGDEREVERLASIVPGFPKDEALQKPKRARKPPKNRPK
jgi:hypothetical protein